MQTEENPAADVTIQVTDEQKSSVHPYEDVFARGTAWLFENMYQQFGARAQSADEFADMIHNFGLNCLNNGRRDVAEAWADFAARKFVDALERTAARAES